MKKSVYVLLLMVLLTGSFLGGTLYNRTGAVKHQAAREDRRILYYVDPMNPSHTSPTPGTAPCGMPLEPVYADEDPGGTGQLAQGTPMSPGTIRINTRKQQMIGIKTGSVAMASDSYRFRTSGKVVPDENRVFRIVGGGEGGWIWDVYGSTSGSLVQKEELMAKAYNYQFLTRGQQYLYALDREKRKEISRQSAARQYVSSSVRSDGQPLVAQDLGNVESDTVATVPPQSATTPSKTEVVNSINNPVELAKLELYNIGVGDYQLQEITRSNKATSDLEIRAPVTGVVLARNVSPRQRFEKGSELFRIADISQVWIVADVFEREARYIQPGTMAVVSVPRQGRKFEVKVSEVLPQFDPVTRTYKVRIEQDNPDFSLLPDAYVDVEFQISLPSSIVVPVDAVINSGSRRVVFVDRGNGFFEPREVQVGWSNGELAEVVEGLIPGENIVTSGNFLLDSESRIKLAAAQRAMMANSHVRAATGGNAFMDPVCGMSLEREHAASLGLITEHNGKSYYFCSPECKAQFEKGLLKNQPAGKNEPGPSTGSSRHGGHEEHDSAQSRHGHDHNTL